MDKLLEQVKEAILKYNEGDTVNFSNKQFIQWLKQLIEMVEGLQNDVEHWKEEYLEFYGVAERLQQRVDVLSYRAERAETVLENIMHGEYESNQELTDKLKIAEEALEKIQICSTIHLAFDITDKALSRMRSGE